MSNSNYTGQETTITVGGKQYTLSRLTRGVMQEFASWAKQFIPDPLANIDKLLHSLKDFPALQEKALKDAIKASKTHGAVSSPEVAEMAQSFEGQLKLVQLLLAKHHPNLSEDEIFQIAVSFAEEQGDSFRPGDAPAV